MQGPSAPPAMPGANPLLFNRATMASARALSLNTPTWRVNPPVASAAGGGPAAAGGAGAGVLDATRVGGTPVPAWTSGFGAGFAAAAVDAAPGVVALTGGGTLVKAGAGFPGLAIPARGRSRLSSTFSPSRRCA